MEMVMEYVETDFELVPSFKKFHKKKDKEERTDRLPC
uniref:Uncharacterized protein n=1 Tax=Fagus sylvatica TaxID=28930 RepID=A0A2N9HSI1_FAGSY